MPKAEDRPAVNTANPKITSVTIGGYRRLRNVSFDMRPLTALIGANGSGKTSVIEAFTILSQSADGKLDSALNQLGGLADVLTAGRRDRVEFHLELSSAQRPFLYQLHLASQGQSYAIINEFLTQNPSSSPKDQIIHVASVLNSASYHVPGSTEVIRPNWDYKTFETALSQVPKMYSDAEALRSWLASCIRYGPLSVENQSPVRLPQRMRPASLPGEHGEDLVSCLYDLREANPERFSMVEDALRAAFPTFEKLAFPPVAAGTLALTWKDRDFSKPFYTHQLSEGTLRFLWLVTLLQSLELPAVTLIDEPEVSMHPAMLTILADLLREASRNSHIIVATHSDHLVRALTPAEVLVCNMDESGETQLRWGDSFDLSRWLQEYTLDQLWDMNIFGGRP